MIEGAIRRLLSIGFIDLGALGIGLGLKVSTFDFFFFWGSDRLWNGVVVVVVVGRVRGHVS